MGLVDDLNPTNYQEEKQRFLNNPTFNPQFHYKREFSQEELSRHGFPADGYQQLAQRIIDATFQQFTPHELQAQRGRLLTQDKVTAAIQQFLQAHRLETRFPIVWQFLLQYYAEDQETAFTIAVKKKRGLTDTSHPGGFTKDLVYFEGFVDITRFMIANHFPIKELYFGKLSWRDVDRAKELNPEFKPLLPIFYTRDPRAYEL